MPVAAPEKEEPQAGGPRPSIGVTSPWIVERQIQAVREGEKLTAVLHAAALAFAQRGFHEASMEDIARSIGISKPTLYNYYRNKDDLLTACQLYAMERFLPAAEEMVEYSGTAIERLEVYFRFNLDCMMTEVGRAFYIIDDNCKNEDILARNRLIRKEIAKAVEKVISDGMAAGEIDSDLEPSLIVRALFGAFNFIPRWYKDEGGMSTREIGEQFFRIFFDGITTRNRTLG